MGVQTSELSIIIRARDRATKALSKIRGGITKFATASRKRFDSVKKSVFSLKTAFAGLAAGAFIRSTISAFQKQTKAVAGMEQAMKSMGRFTPQLSKRMQDLASNIQDVGISGDEAVIEGTKFLMTYRQITDDLMPDAIKAMADLSALTGGDMAQSANILGKAAMGMTGMLARYGITLSEAAKKSKDFKTILGEITEQVGGQQKALRDATGGELYAFGNAWGDLKEKVGGAIVEGINPYLKDLVKTIEELGTGTKGMGPIFINAFEKAILIGARIADGYKIAKMAVIEFGIATVKARVLAEEAVSFNWWDDFVIGLSTVIAGEKTTIKAIQATAAARKFEATGISELSDAEIALIELEQIKRENIKESFSTYEDAIIWIQKLKDAKKAAAEADKPQKFAGDPFGLIKLTDAHISKTKKLIGVRKGLVDVDKILADNLADRMEKKREEFELEKKLTAQAKAHALIVAETYNVERQRKYDAEQQKIMSNYEQIYSSVTAIATVIGDNIVGAIDAAQKGTLSWKKALLKTTQDLSKMLIQTAVKAGISLLASGVAGSFQGTPSVIPSAPGSGGTVVQPSFARGGFIPPPISAASGMMFNGPQTIRVADNKGKKEVLLPVDRGADGVMGIHGGGGGGDTIINFNGMPDAHSARAAYQMVSEDIGQDIQRQREERGL